MPNGSAFNIFSGTGTPISERKIAMPMFSLAYSGNEDPQGYVIDSEKGLKEAVNVAIALGQPLLLTGEPGVGKTTLAKSISNELGLDLFTFHTKTTSTATDLFYSYDMMGQYAALHIRKEDAPTKDFIHLNALGKAILHAVENPSAEIKELYNGSEVKNPTRSVVLIDEIDKAPRDLPNDILHEIDHMEFTIKEMQNLPIVAEKKYRPIVIITSNSERNLPDAFLRRCVFFHIEFPSAAILKEIVKKRFRKSSKVQPDFSEKFLNETCAHLEEIRKIGLKKKPATAEFLAWLSILKTFYDEEKTFTEQKREDILLSYSALVKTREDLAMLEKHLQLPR